MPASDEENDGTPFTLALIAGGIAGTTVDVALYPLDALKTRLQHPDGFWKAGGFSGIYRGVLATALGASPGSAMFFSAYEGMKPRLKAMNGGKEHWLHHSFAASCGEVATAARGGAGECGPDRRPARGGAEGHRFGAPPAGI